MPTTAEEVTWFWWGLSLFQDSRRTLAQISEDPPQMTRLYSSDAVLQCYMYLKICSCGVLGDKYILCVRLITRGENVSHRQLLFRETEKLLFLITVRESWWVPFPSPSGSNERIRFQRSRLHFTTTLWSGLKMPPMSVCVRAAPRRLLWLRVNTEFTLCPTPSNVTRVISGWEMTSLSADITVKMSSYVAHKSFLGSSTKVFGISAFARASAVSHARRCVLMFSKWRVVSLDLSWWAWRPSDLLAPASDRCHRTCCNWQLIFWLFSSDQH